MRGAAGFFRQRLRVEPDELAADLALIFGWQPSELSALTLDEAIAWHRRAIARAHLILTPQMRGTTPSRR
ncbi:GpE family phage tail protein [Tistrella mobilis]|uniref:GpE family phage tail protein n=1 Tax=Tistrella mobilis TaxID=171437 RepID=UPI003556AFF7